MIKTPWTLIDPTDDGSGILARIVTDREMGHVAVFESPETAHATVETMNRAESAEQERRELERELAETRAKLEAVQSDRAAELAARGQYGFCAPAERAVLDAMRDQDQQELEWCADPDNSSIWREQSVAELARRGEKPNAHAAFELKECTVLGGEPQRPLPGEPCAVRRGEKP